MAGPINSALAKLRSAGAVLVPFDSSAFQELAVSAWPGATADTINNLDASSAYESIEVLGRQAVCGEGHLHASCTQLDKSASTAVCVTDFCPESLPHVTICQ